MSKFHCWDLNSERLDLPFVFITQLFNQEDSLFHFHFCVYSSIAPLFFRKLSIPSYQVFSANSIISTKKKKSKMGISMKDFVTQKVSSVEE